MPSSPSSSRSTRCRIHHFITSTASTAYYMHAKVVLADYGLPTARMFVGSENFSSASLTRNRELGLIFSDGAAMTAMDADIAADFKNGTAF